MALGPHGHCSLSWRPSPQSRRGLEETEAPQPAGQVTGSSPFKPTSAVKGQPGSPRPSTEAQRQEQPRTAAQPLPPAPPWLTCRVPDGGSPTGDPQRPPPARTAGCNGRAPRSQRLDPLSVAGSHGSQAPEQRLRRFSAKAPSAQQGKIHNVWRPT